MILGTRLIGSNILSGEVFKFVCIIKEIKNRRIFSVHKYKIVESKIQDIWYIDEQFFDYNELKVLLEPISLVPSII